MRRSSRSLQRVGSAAALLSAIASCSGSGCSESSGAGQGAASPTSAGTHTTTSSGATIAGTGSGLGGSGGAEPCAPEPIPPVVPDGWVEYTDWSCECRFYVPGSQDAMPAPIAWEPCPLSPGGIDCRVMVTDWTESSAPVAYYPSFERLADGRALLGFRRVAEEYLLDLVAEVDGAVRMAILQTGPTLWDSDPGCMLTLDDVNEGKYIFDVRGHSSIGHQSDSVHRGSIGGNIDDPEPTVVAHYTDGLVYSWQASANWVSRVNTPLFEVYVSSWSMSQDIFVTSPPNDPDHLHGGQFLLSGDALFWSTSTLKMIGINVWDPVGGTRPFIRWVGDYTKGAGGLGTDGVDLVWSYGEGKQPNDIGYPIRSIMTAPFTSDPAALQPRRLRSQPDGAFGASRWRVGCGYGAHTGGAANVLVVRLSDGVSWLVPSPYPEQPLHTPIGLTCDELFVMGRIGDKTTIGRVRLDSLGPGMPPD